MTAPALSLNKRSNSMIGIRSPSLLCKTTKTSLNPNLLLIMTLFLAIMSCLPHVYSQTATSIALTQPDNWSSPIGLTVTLSQTTAPTETYSAQFSYTTLSDCTYEPSVSKTFTLTLSNGQAVVDSNNITTGYTVISSSPTTWKEALQIVSFCGFDSIDVIISRPNTPSVGTATFTSNIQGTPFLAESRLFLYPQWNTINKDDFIESNTVPPVSYYFNGGSSGSITVSWYGESLVGQSPNRPTTSFVLTFGSINQTCTITGSSTLVSAAPNTYPDLAFYFVSLRWANLITPCNLSSQTGDISDISITISWTRPENPPMATNQIAVNNKAIVIQNNMYNTSLTDITANNKYYNQINIPSSQIIAKYYNLEWYYILSLPYIVTSVKCQLQHTYYATQQDSNGIYELIIPPLVTSSQIKDAIFSIDSANPSASYDQFSGTYLYKYVINPYTSNKYIYDNGIFDIDTAMTYPKSAVTGIKTTLTSCTGTGDGNPSYSSLSPRFSIQNGPTSHYVLVRPTGLLDSMYVTLPKEPQRVFTIDIHYVNTSTSYNASLECIVHYKVESTSSLVIEYTYTLPIIIPVTDQNIDSATYTITIPFNDIISSIITNQSLSSVYSIEDLRVTVTLTDDNAPTPVSIVWDNSYTTPSALTPMCSWPYTLDCSKNQQDVCITANTLPWSDPSHPKQDPTICTCQDGWTGQYCQQDERCATQWNTALECNGFGTIDYDTTANSCNTRCSCDSSRIGRTCQQDSKCKTQFDNVNECNDRGLIRIIAANRCQTVCTCDPVWAGDDCSQTTDCDVAKTIFGTCPTGQVVHTTVDSTTKICTASCICQSEDICSGHGYQNTNTDGVCDTSTCQCDSGWTGDKCDRPTVCESIYNGLSMCNQHGTVQYKADATGTTADDCSSECSCDNSWVGTTCNETTDCGLAVSNFPGCPNNQSAFVQADPVTKICTVSCLCFGSDICSGHGSQRGNADGTCDTTVCSCNADRVGDNCERPKVCEATYVSLDQCSGRGTVQFKDGTTNQAPDDCSTECACNGTWAGDNCSQTTDCDVAKGLIGSCPAGQILHTTTDPTTMICTAVCICSGSGVCSEHGYQDVNTDGTCNTTACHCDSEWTGDNCQRPKVCEPVYTTLHQCNQHGIVDFKDDATDTTADDCSSECTCDGTWTDNDCSQTTDCDAAKTILGSCPTGQVISTSVDSTTKICTAVCICQNSDVCSGHGYQDVDADGVCNTTTCHCDSDYTGDKCERPTVCEATFDSLNKCSGHGTVQFKDDATGTTADDCSTECACDGTWAGADCSQTTDCDAAKTLFEQSHTPVCPPGQIIFTSVLDEESKICTAFCVCDIDDDDDNTTTSPDVCSGHGYYKVDIDTGLCTKTTTQECQCHDDWTGTNCDRIKKCESKYIELNQCSQHGYIDINTTTNECMSDCTCYEPTIWGSSNCSQTYQCDTAIDILMDNNDSKCNTTTNEDVYTIIDNDTGYCTAHCGCRSSDICSGHGIAPYTTGNTKQCSDSVCHCDDDYTGPTCQRPVKCEAQYNTLQQCSGGHGYVALKSDGTCNTLCTCDGTWVGDDCSQTSDCTVAKTLFGGCSKASEGIYTDIDQDTNACTVHCGCSGSTICSGHGVQPYLPDGTTCSDTCVCTDASWFGITCQHRTKCMDTITQLDECNNHGTVQYNTSTQRCQSSCTCDDKATWGGATCSQLQKCRSTGNILNCGSYGYVDTVIKEDETILECDDRCTCLFGFTGTYCTDCSLQCYRGTVNPSTLCRDDIKSNVKPCLCTQNASGRYCQYYNLTTRITIRNRALPQWLVESVTAGEALNIRTTNFLTSLTAEVNSMLSFPDNILTNKYDTTYDKIYNKDETTRTLIPISSLSVGNTSCEITDNTTGTIDVVKIPSILSLSIINTVGEQYSTLMKEATNLQSKWNILLQSPLSLQTLINKVFNQYNISGIDYNTCMSSGDDLTLIVPADTVIDEYERNENNNGNDGDGDNSSYNHSYHIFIYITLLLSYVIYTITVF